MLTLASPAWLLGLLCVPAIWYLHRSGPILRRHPVASLELWQDERARAAQSGTRRPPDPAWLRRAAVLALFCVALAEPKWQRPAERVTLWIDDSLSMQTVEQGTTRLDRGLRLAQAALRESGVRDVMVRPLSEPARRYSAIDAATIAAIRSHAGQSEPRLPAPAQLAPSRAHWLLTDGADEAVNAWLGDAAVERVIQVATGAGNVGITSAAVRPQPADASSGVLQVVLRNGGTGPEERTIAVSVGSATLATKPVAIEAGATVSLIQPVPLPAQRLAVRLIPADALPEDDHADIDLAALQPVVVHVDAACPRDVLRAIDAHPALAAGSGANAGLVIDCGSGWPDGETAPRIVLGRGAAGSFDAAAALWSQSFAGARRRVAELPSRTLGRLDAPRANDEVLLAAADVPLIIRRAGSPRVVETVLDLGATESVASGSVPLLVALLADVALDDALLERTARLDRGTAASMIASRGVLAAAPESARAARHDAAPFVLPLLMLASALLAWDVLALTRQWLRARPRRERSNA